MPMSFASLLGGLAPTSDVLILARAIQGFGGALMAASSLGIITANFAEERHARREHEPKDKPGRKIE